MITTLTDNNHLEMMQALIVFIPAMLHLILAIYMVAKIKNNAMLTSNQKRLNIFLIITVPFIWSILVYYILKREPTFNEKKKTISNGYDDSLLVTNLDNANHNQH